jgi:hypothetical protein
MLDLLQEEESELIALSDGLKGEELEERLIEFAERLGVEYEEVVEKRKELVRRRAWQPAGTRDQRLEMLANFQEAFPSGGAKRQQLAWLVHEGGMTVSGAAKWVGVRYTQAYNSVYGKNRVKKYDNYNKDN